MPVVVIATITPQPEHSDVVRAAITESVPAIHAEDGCELYAVHDAGDSIVIVEQWSSESTLKAHGAGEPVRKVQATISDKLATPTSLVHANPMPQGDQVKGRLVGPAA